jgi:hypothetical protein
MLDALQHFTESIPAAVQWLGVMLLGAIPFVESYLGSIVGILAGVPPVIAIAAAIIGNIISMLVFVLTAHRVRARVTRDQAEPERSPRRQKLKEHFDRWGVPGVSLLGQLVLPSQITSATIVSFGAPRNTVILWQCISIVMWGVVCGGLAALGLNLFEGR